MRWAVRRQRRHRSSGPRRPSERSAKGVAVVGPMLRVLEGGRHDGCDHRGNHGRGATSAPKRGFEFFASPPDGPRVRRSSDTAVAVAGAILVAILAVVRGNGTSVDAAWTSVVAVLPAWLTWCADALYVLSVATAGALLVGIALLGRRRLELLRDLVLAAALAVVAAAALARFVDGQWPAVALTNLDQTRTTFPAFLVTAVIAVQAAAAGPHLAAPIRLEAIFKRISASGSSTPSTSQTCRDARSRRR
jgi:hypothetical protein